MTAQNKRPLIRKRQFMYVGKFYVAVESIKSEFNFYDIKQKLG
jgi:hypothetical protein